MSGSCFKYKKKLINWDSGCGDPWYVYEVYPKDARDKDGFLKDGVGIKFGYNNKEDRDKVLEKVKKYIDDNYDKLLECNFNEIGECRAKQCDIFYKKEIIK